MYFAPYRIPRASVLASALIGAALTLQMNGALAQGGMSDMKKMPGMNDMKMNDTKKATTANGTGTMTALNAANHKVTSNHGPIPAINWPPIKSEFAVASSVDLAKLKTAHNVNFTPTESGNNFTLQSISPP